MSSLSVIVGQILVFQEQQRWSLKVFPSSTSTSADMGKLKFTTSIDIGQRYRSILDGKHLGQYRSTISIIDIVQYRSTTLLNIGYRHRSIYGIDIAQFRLLILHNVILLCYYFLKGIPLFLYRTTNVDKPTRNSKTRQIL